MNLSLSDYVLMVGHFGLMLASSFAAARLLCRQTMSWTWLACGTAVVAAAQSVILCEVLSLGGMLNRPSLVIGQFLMATALCVSSFAAHKRLRPTFPKLSKAEWPEESPCTAYDRVLYCLVIALAVTKGFQLLQVWALPLIVGDVITYHAPRVAMWLQQESILHFPTWELRMNFSPKGTHTLTAQVALFTGSFRMVEVIQWLASVLLPLCVYELAIFAGCHWRQALLAAVASASLPIVLSQSITAQNDIVVTFFTTAFVLFTLRGIQMRDIGLLALGGAALGLAVGTKLVMVWFGLPVAMLVIWALVKFKAPLRTWLVTLLAAILGVTTLGSFAQVENYVLYGDFFVYSDFLIAVFNPTDLAALMLRYTYQLIDPSGLPIGIARSLDGVRRWLFDGVLSLAHRHIEGAGSDFAYLTEPSFNHPVLSWYGVFGFTLLAPYSLFCVLSPRRWRSGSALFCLPLIGMWFMYSATFPYADTQGRLFMFCFTLAWVSAAAVFAGGSELHGRRTRLLVSAVAVFLTASSFYCTIVYDQRKGGALLDPAKVRDSSEDYVTTYETVLEGLIPPGSRIGLANRLWMLAQFMDPALHHRHVFLVHQDWYTPLDPKKPEEFESVARDYGVDYIVGPRNFLIGEPPSSDQWIVTPELVFFSRTEWRRDADRMDIERLRRVQRVVLPASWSGYP